MVTSLATLRGVDPAHAGAVLAGAAEQLLPAWALDASVIEGLGHQDADRVKTLIREVRGKAPKDGPARDTFVLNTLTAEMNAALLGDADPDAIRARVGNKGLLPQTLYQIMFTARYEDRAEFLAVKRNHVENAIRKAEMVQHLRTTIENGDRTTPLVSLFVQTPKVNGPPFSIFVKAERMGSALHVDDAVRIYHDEVDLIGATSPVEILARFLKIVGVPVTLGGEQYPYIVSKVIPPEDQPIHMESAGGGNVEIAPPPGTKAEPFEIVMAYSMNDFQYAEYLLRHGVSVDPTGKQGFGLYYHGQQEKR